MSFARIVLSIQFYNLLNWLCFLCASVPNVQMNLDASQSSKIMRIEKLFPRILLSVCVNRKLKRMRKKKQHSHSFLLLRIWLQSTKVGTWWHDGKRARKISDCSSFAVRRISCRETRLVLRCSTTKALKQSAKKTRRKISNFQLLKKTTKALQQMKQTLISSGW